MTIQDIAGTPPGDIARGRERAQAPYPRARKDLLRNINGVLILASVAEEHGMAIDALLKGSGLEPAQMNLPTTTVSYEQEFRLIRNLLEHCGDRAGLGCEAGEKYFVTSLVSVGFALVSSPSLRSAFDIVFRYADLHSSMVRMALNDDVDDGKKDLNIRLIEEELPTDVCRFVVERTAAATWGVGGILLGRRLVPSRWDVTWPEPANAAVYTQHSGMQPTFGMPVGVLSIARADADASFAQSNPLALKLAEENCRQYLASWKLRTGVASQVRDLVSAQSRLMPPMDQVAAAMHMSIRTLRRRLDQEGVTYSGLCDEVRQAMAERLLAMRRLPVGQIAERLGYADSSGFIHAFKRWTGQTPAAFRAGIV